MYTFSPGEHVIWIWKLPDESKKRVSVEVVTYSGNGLTVKLLEDVVDAAGTVLARKDDIQAGILPYEVEDNAG